MQYDFHEGISGTIRESTLSTWIVPKSAAISGQSLQKALNIFQKKPYIEADKCVRCGICVNSCPVPGKAVDFRNGKNSRQFMTIRNVSAASAARKCARRRRLR
ncbi:MAG: 4Fe-4S dicluster domain-containing protein [Ruminococcus sp.]